MNSDDLTREQWKALEATLRRHYEYLARLLQRMQLEGIPETDVTRQRTKAAYDAMHNLWMHVHYGVCGLSDTGLTGAHSPAMSNRALQSRRLTLGH